MFCGSMTVYNSTVAGANILFNIKKADLCLGEKKNWWFACETNCGTECSCPVFQDYAVFRMRVLRSVSIAFN